MITCTPETKARLRAEIERLAGAKHHLRGYVDMMVSSNPGWVGGEHIGTICDTIEDFLNSDVRGLIITTPPRHMKSTICSECLPAWFLSNDRQREVIIASYNQTQARKMSRASRLQFESDWHKRIFPNQQFVVDQVDEFQLSGKLNGRPSLIAAGIGSGVTGSGADLLVIDDPIKDMEEANSPLMRDKAYDWFLSVATTRLSPGGKVLLVMTRWHHDDLVGRVLNDDKDGWRVLHMPAIGTDPSSARFGCALWPERFSIEDLESKRKVMGTRLFESLYQGRPTPLEGGRFKRSWMHTVGERFPETAPRCRYWDKAATADGGDYTTGVLMAEADGRYCIEDVIHVQYSSAQVQLLIGRTAEADGAGVKIRMEQEPGSSGVDVIDMYARRILHGYDFRGEKVTGDKATRSEPMEAAFECGNIDIVRAHWNRTFIDELCEFPLGPHDDQVDAASGAFRELSTTPPQRLYFLG